MNEKMWLNLSAGNVGKRKSVSWATLSADSNGQGGMWGTAFILEYLEGIPCWLPCTSLLLHIESLHVSKEVRLASYITRWLSPTRPSALPSLCCFYCWPPLNYGNNSRATLGWLCAHTFFWTSSARVKRAAASCRERKEEGTQLFPVPKNPQALAILALWASRANPSSRVGLSWVPIYFSPCLHLDQMLMIFSCLSTLIVIKILIVILFSHGLLQLLTAFQPCYCFLLAELICYTSQQQSVGDSLQAVEMRACVTCMNWGCWIEMILCVTINFSHYGSLLKWTLMLNEWQARDSHYNSGCYIAVWRHFALKSLHT